MVNLSMTSFWLHKTGTPGVWEDDLTDPQWYWLTAQGLCCFAVSGPNTPKLWADLEGKITRFPFWGDPMKKTGWLDGGMEPYFWGGTGTFGYSIWPGDVRMMMSSGPFTMALGDTQEVVIAVIAAKGSDGPMSTAVVKYYAKRLRSIYVDLEEAVQSMRQTASERQEVMPTEYALSQNYPNPFNPSTTIEFLLPFDLDVRLTIHDLLGRVVNTLVDRRLTAGSYQATWYGNSASGDLLPSGVYVYRLEAGHVQIVRKLLLLR
jgi:hypothetical protein